MVTPPIVDRGEERHNTTGQENLLAMSIRKELAMMISHGGIYTREAVIAQSSGHQPQEDSTKTND